MTNQDLSVATNELLLQHVGWLRRLARSLVADQNLAEDLVQDTMLTALEKPPVVSSSQPLMFKGWLSRVLRNRLSEGTRAETLRKDRELLVKDGRPESSSEPQLIEHLHTQRELADVLLKLEEPFRSAILLRFYEGLPPRKIAKRTGDSLATVNSRLQRGLAKLRQRLDAEHDGDRTAWLSALLPLANWSPQAAVSTTLGGLAMKTKTLAAIGIAAATAGVLMLVTDSETQVQVPEESSSDVTALVDDQASENPGERQAPTQPEDSGTRTPVVEPTKPQVVSQAEQAAEPVLRNLRGRLLNGFGEPLAALSLAVDGGRLLSTADPNGWFEFETSEERVNLSVSDPGWVTIRRAVWSLHSPLDPVVVAAPALNVTGSVLNQRAERVVGARVMVLPPADFESRFSDVIESSIQLQWETSSDAQGGFRLQSIPQLSGASLRVIADGYDALTTELPVTDTSNLEFVLNSSRPSALAYDEPGQLHGRVLTSDERGVSGARVAMGFGIARTDGNGFFTLDLDRCGDTNRVQAVAPGWLPASMSRPQLPSGDNSGWPGFVELRMGSEPAHLNGQLVDSKGEPLANAKVLLADPTTFGVVGHYPLRLEGLMAGLQVPANAMETAAEGLEPGEDSVSHSTPALEPDALLPWVVTDKSGRFRMDGLDNRPYQLRFVAANLGWDWTSEPVEPTRAADASEGSGSKTNSVIFQRPDPELYPIVRGQVLAGSGQGVAGVRIQTWLPGVDEELNILGGRSNILRFLLGTSISTDQDGFFEMRDIPKSGLSFHIVSDEILPIQATSDMITDPLNVQIPVSVRVHLKLTLAAPTDRADSFVVKNSWGQAMQILTVRKDGYNTLESAPLNNGQSPVVTVTTEAASLHLLKEGKEIDRIPLQLQIGDTNVLTY